MRINKDNYQQFYAPDILIVLDGVVQYYCVEVDTDEGWIKRVQLDDDGYFKTVDGEHVIEQLFGNVTIEGELL